MPTALASLVAQLTPGEKAVRLLPAGRFRATDGSGRPKDAPAWWLDGKSAAALIARHEARASRRVVDYEHQTLRAAENGRPAPAAGWITGLEWREGDGLYASLEWTEPAAAMIAAGEYRYISPVFPYDQTGRVLDIRMAGLTNDPGLDGLTDLAALSALMPTQEDRMDELLERLRYLLNLPLTSTPEDISAELDKLKTMITTSGAASLTAALTAVAQASSLPAFDAAGATPDPAKYVPVDAVAELQAQVAALSATLAKNELDDLVEAGLADGRLNAALESWARTLTPAALTAYLDKATPIAALAGTQTGGKEPAAAAASGAAGLTAEQLAVCTALGMSPEVYATGLPATHQE